MSDVQARPAAARGRGSSARGGRGGLSSRGGRGTTRSAATNGDSEHTSLPTLEDQGEIADLNKTHGSNLPVLKELFPNWSEVDLLYALKETDGDVTVTIERIAEGNISQWGEVSSQKKDRTKSKAKDTFTTTTGADGPAATRTARGGRVDGTRGRGRVTDRGGRGAIRGRSVKPATDAARAKENQPLSVPTDESNAWDTTKTNDDGGWAQAAAANSWGASAATDSTPAVASKSAETPVPAAAPQGTQKTWASMLRQSTAPKPAPQPPKEVPAIKPEPALEPLPAVAAEPSPAPAEAEAEAEAEAPTETATSAPAPVPEDEPESIAELSAEPQEEQIAADTTTVADISNPPRTDTVASEAADSWDPRAATLSATATPLSASQAQHQPHKTPASGFAATAIKATERTALPRTAPNHQRRFLDQQEAVRMPVATNQQLERTTLQFGAFNLNGGEDDIDGDREEPETRAQPPADSPVTQPRASLPPAPQAALPDAYPAQKTVPALPSGPTSAVAQATPTAPAVQQTGSQAAAPQPPTQPAAQQFGRFGQTTSQEQSPFPQKPFDTYNQGNQPSAAQSHLDNFPGQQPSQAQPQTQQPAGAYSSAADQYSSYYTADQQSRLPYSFYGQGYGQQQQQQQQQTGQGQGQQEGGIGSRAGFGAYGASQADLASQYPQSTNQTRFGTAVSQDQSSGNTTPNPSSTQTQQPTSQTHPQSHVGQQQHGNQYFGQQPYYGGYYSANYMNNQYGYGGFGPYGKGGVYGQPHHYGMSQQSPYDHGSSAASGYPQSTLHRADSGAASGLGDYGRAGSAQSAAQPGLGGSAGFGGIHDAFGRGASSYGAQTGQAFNAPSTQPSGAASGNEDLKPFNDAKTAGGPSPSLASSGRPGSATNTAPSQTSLPPPQSAQPGMGGYGGYPSHLSHGLHSQSGSTGYGMAAGPAQGHQNSPYSGYGGFGGGNSYYGSQQSRHGGWGSNYSGGNGF